jgi:hypothetical protein
MRTLEGYLAVIVFVMIVEILCAPGDEGLLPIPLSV